MLDVFLVISISVLVLLVLRFILPELIYSVRGFLTMIRARKAFLDYKSGRNSGQTFRELQMANLRYETFNTGDESFIFRRVTKLRELYRILGTKRRGSNQLIGENQEVCMIELASIIRSLARRIRANPSYRYSKLLHADAFLTLIANSVREADGLSPLDKEKELEYWFTENPISIEQTIELLISAVFGLAYRLRDRQLPPVGVARSPYIDHFSAILEMERKLRFLVGAKYIDVFGQDELEKVFRQILGGRLLRQILKRQRDWTSSMAGVTRPPIVEFLSLVHLQKLLNANWSFFENYFEAQEWLEIRLEKVIDIRNETAHSREVPRRDRHRCVSYCQEICERIKK